MTFPDQLKRNFPYLLLAAYGVFMCGYFFLDDYASHYRLFSMFLFFLGIFAFVGGLRDSWKHPAFLTVVAYMVYLLLLPAPNKTTRGPSR